MQPDLAPPLGADDNARDEEARFTSEITDDVLKALPPRAQQMPAGTPDDRSERPCFPNPLKYRPLNESPFTSKATGNSIKPDLSRSAGSRPHSTADEHEYLQEGPGTPAPKPSTPKIHLDPISRTDKSELGFQSTPSNPPRGIVEMMQECTSAGSSSRTAQRGALNKESKTRQSPEVWTGERSIGVDFSKFDASKSGLFVFSDVAKGPVPSACGSEALASEDGWGDSQHSEGWQKMCIRLRKLDAVHERERSPPDDRPKMDHGSPSISRDPGSVAQDVDREPRELGKESGSANTADLNAGMEARETANDRTDRASEDNEKGEKDEAERDGDERERDEGEADLDKDEYESEQEDGEDRSEAGAYAVAEVDHRMGTKARL